MEKRSGASANDELIGGIEDDQMLGGAGHDQLDGGAGRDLLIGGRGDDQLSGSAGSDLLIDGRGRDVLEFRGGGGHDQLDGGTGRNLLIGGRGDDQLSGSAGSDLLIGGRGRDALEGGEDDDELRGGRGHDQLDGGAGRDLLIGGRGDDQLSGSAGRDLLIGGRGRDALEGGEDDDELRGGRGHDQLDGGAGRDLLIGGRGRDVLEGGGGDDELHGGRGSDLFLYRSHDGDDHIDGGGGIDRLLLDIDDDWVLTLNSGQIVAEGDGHIKLSAGAAGTIELADGSTIHFEDIEQIEGPAMDGGGMPPTDLSLLAEPIAENAPGGRVVGTVSASDPDDGDTLTYALTDDADGRFVIDPDSGVVTVAAGAALDYETAAGHQIEAKVTDAHGLSATRSFAIQVTDVNERPTVLALSANQVAENAPGGRVVGTVSATDPDAGDSLSYALLDDADGRFVIDPDSGVVTVAAGAALDYETAAGHQIEVKVTDAHGLSATRSFAIQVTDVNERPTVLALSANQVAENAPGGRVVGTVSATDPDAGDSLSYALLDDADGRFAIDPNTGEISVTDGAELDQDIASEHQIEVEVTDGDGLSGSATYVIAVTDANGAPSVLGLSANQVAENAPGGRVVGTVSASDPDDGDTLTYALTDDADGRFVIDPDSGVVTVAAGAALDYETAAGHQIEAKVTDAHGLSATRSFAIQVTDVNERPTVLALSANQVAENAPGGRVVGTVSATDPDAGDSLSYALLDDADGRFAIDPNTGEISVTDGAELDQDIASEHQIEVEVTDGDGLSGSATYVIAVTDANGAPSVLGLSANQFAENAPGGRVVGTVSASDPDDGDTLTYALTDDADGRFVIDPDSGVVTVAAGAALDYETAAGHQIEAKVTDAHGLSATRSFAIQVTDVNERPTVLALSANQVAENAPGGRVVGTVSATDPDAGDSLSYALLDDADGRFVIDPDSGVVTVAGGAALDYETAAGHQIEAKVTDAHGLSATRSFAIQVTDVNERPTVLALSANQVAENAPGGRVVGTVSATDPDGDTLTYALTDDADGRFVIDPDSGVVTVAGGAALDYETAAGHQIEAKVTDAHGLSATRSFAIQVTDVNERPTVLALSANQVAENAPGGRVVGTVSATDPDAGDSLSYALLDDADGRFVIDPDSGVVTVAGGAALDYETAAGHQIEAKVTDAHGLSATRSFAIQVTDVNEAPPPPPPPPPVLGLLDAGQTDFWM